MLLEVVGRGPVRCAGVHTALYEAAYVLGWDATDLSSAPASEMELTTALAAPLRLVTASVRDPRGGSRTDVQ